jgi:Arc/MetJ family transcription regulator
LATRLRVKISAINGGAKGFDYIFGCKPQNSYACNARDLPDQVVYRWCMTRTNIDIDDDACRAVIERYHLATKRDAVNFALRTVAAEPLGLAEARHLRGSGWEGYLDRQSNARVG